MTERLDADLMILKILIVLLVCAILLALIFPKTIPRVLRGAGRTAGSAGRLGRELATGHEEPGSPLAEYETHAGEALLTKLLAERPLCRDRGLQREVATVGERLAAQAARRSIPYRFFVVEDEEIESFAIPGGAVVVTRAFVEACRGDAQRLAGLLAHEVAHIDLRHGARQMAASFAAKTGARLLGGGLVLSRVTSELREVLLTGYRHDTELEADGEAVDLARRAGYDPAGLERALRGLSELAPGCKYLTSHPAAAERIARLR